MNDRRHNGKEYLSHHGILGMRWGKKNGPPYPLGDEDHSASEEKAGWEDSLDKKGKSDSAKATSNREDSKKSNQDIVSEALRKNPNIAAANLHPSALDKAGKFLYDHRKQIIVGVAATAAIAAGAYYVKQHGGMKAANMGFSGAAERFNAAWVGSDFHRLDALTNADYAAMSSEPITLSKGSQLFRLSKSEHSTLREGIEYISTNEADRMRYKAFLPRMWKANDPSNPLSQVFETTLTAKEDIKAPGKKIVVDTLAEVLQSQKGYSASMAKEQSLKDFNRIMLMAATRGDRTANALFRSLQEKGYNAIIDYNDAGRLSDAPMILFNGAKSASVKATESIPQSTFKGLINNITPPKELLNYSHSDYVSELGKLDPGMRLAYQLFQCRLDTAFS